MGKRASLLTGRSRDMRYLMACLCLIVCYVLVSKCEAAAAADPVRTSFLVSPDGQYLAYGVPGYDEEGEKATRIMVCDLDGAGKREVGTVPWHWDEVVWVGHDRVLCTLSRMTWRAARGALLREVGIAYDHMTLCCTGESRWRAWVCLT